MTSSQATVVDDRTIETTVTGQGFCQTTRPYTLHFVTRFDRPFRTTGTWADSTFTPGSTQTSGAGRRGAWAGFDATTDHDVVAVTAISYVDAAGARANLAAEGAGTFAATHAATHAATRAAWATRLGTVETTGGAAADRGPFYSSLYRSLITPSTGSDVDRRYRGFDDAVHTADGGACYQNFSLWDTYRTQAQLLGLLAPEEARDQAVSLLRAGQQGGWAPRWVYGNVETNIMTGDPVTPFLVTAWQYGLLNGHLSEVYQLLKVNADQVPPASSPANGRAGNPSYIANGFVPYVAEATGKPGDYDLAHGASATMEYAVSDCSLSTLAAALGRDDDAERYALRCRGWQSLIDPSTGFPRARNADGVFVGNADPAYSEGFHEGTAWQYQWLVPQDMPGAISSMGGAAQANSRLDHFFDYSELLIDPARVTREVWVNSAYDYYGQSRYNPQNEPDLHAPYVYLWTGQPWKTADVVRAATTLFTDGPTGMTGNDDLGTMSAWHVLSSIGIYPVGRHPDAGARLAEVHHGHAPPDQALLLRRRHDLRTGILGREPLCPAGLPRGQGAHAVLVHGRRPPPGGDPAGRPRSASLVLGDRAERGSAVAVPLVGAGDADQPLDGARPDVRDVVADGADRDSGAARRCHSRSRHPDTRIHPDGRHRHGAGSPDRHPPAGGRAADVTGQAGDGVGAARHHRARGDPARQLSPEGHGRLTHR